MTVVVIVSWFESGQKSATLEVMDTLLVITPGVMGAVAVTVILTGVLTGR